MISPTFWIQATNGWHMVGLAVIAVFLLFVVEMVRDHLSKRAYRKARP